MIDDLGSEEKNCVTVKLHVRWVVRRRSWNLLMYFGRGRGCRRLLEIERKNL
jgi:hypothetical protein